MKRWCYVLNFFVVFPVFSDTPTTILQEKLQSIHSMSASFQQVVRAKGHDVSHSSGTMALLRPGRFRWQTMRPMKQWVIADGHKLWIYDVDLEQVSVKKQAGNLEGTAALFLSNEQGMVARDFDVQQDKKGNRDVFKLRAKSNKAHFERVMLVFSGDLLKGIELFDLLGQKTIVTFDHIKTNQNVSASLFQFKAPAGVDVVSQ